MQSVGTMKPGHEADFIWLQDKQKLRGLSFEEEENILGLIAGFFGVIGRRSVSWAHLHPHILCEEVGHIGAVIGNYSQTETAFFFWSGENG